MISTVELFLAFLFLYFLQVASYSTCFDLSVLSERTSSIFYGSWLLEIKKLKLLLDVLCRWLGLPHPYCGCHMWRPSWASFVCPPRLDGFLREDSPDLLPERSGLAAGVLRSDRARVLVASTLSVSACMVSLSPHHSDFAHTWAWCCLGRHPLFFSPL